MMPGKLLRTGAGAWDDADDELPGEIGRIAAGDAADVQASVQRRRAIVMAAYRASVDAQASVPGRMAVGLPQRRRWAFALVTALLTLTLGVAGVAASTAGGPLYPVRLATEEVFLPAAGEDRLAAQLGRLDRRIGEAEAASAAGNRQGLEAALAAYRDIAAAVEAGAPEQLALTVETRLRLRDRIRDQVSRLEAMQAVDPGPMSFTIDAGRRLGERVGGQQGPGPGGPGGPGDGPDSRGQGSGGIEVLPTATPPTSPTDPESGPPSATGSGAPSVSNKPACGSGPICRGGRAEPGTGSR